MRSEPVHIVCFGNELHGDDGFGPALYERLAALPLPAGVQAMRADVAGLGAIRCFEACSRALVVDALHGFGEPGSLHVLTPGQIEPEAGGFHGSGVGGLLAMLPAVLPQPPSIRVVGVELAAVQAFVPGLSRPVAAALDDALAKVLELAQ